MLIVAISLLFYCSLIDRNCPDFHVKNARHIALKVFSDFFSFTKFDQFQVIF